MHGDFEHWRELGALAKEHVLSKAALNRLYCQHWQTQVKACSDESGWKLLDIFRATVETYRFKLKRREQGIKQAAWEIFRLELVGKADYTFHDLVGFVKWYGVLKSKISRAIGHLYEYHGDSFADLIDSYPLAGRELVGRALATCPASSRPRREGYLDEAEVAGAVQQRLGSRWHNLICHGENYVARALELACYRALVHRIVRDTDELVPWTEEERSMLHFAGQFDE